MVDAALRFPTPEEEQAALKRPEFGKSFTSSLKKIVIMVFVEISGV
jgi:hypothetical protein